MNRIYLLLALVSLVGLSSCKKDAGSGGMSSIAGNISGRNYSKPNDKPAEKEVTAITLPNGNDIEDGEYILLNTPSGGTNYYVWFAWSIGVQPDPALSGRTGIKVLFNYSESNTTVAAHLAAAISASSGNDFIVSVENDIVSIINQTAGEVTDAEELSSNVQIDVSNQGKAEQMGSESYVEGPIVEERVYLVYGEEDFYSESVRTDGKGNYQFVGLNRGKYKVYVFTSDTLNPNGMLTQLETAVEITNKKEVVQAPNLFVYQY